MIADIVGIFSLMVLCFILSAAGHIEKRAGAFLFCVLFGIGFMGLGLKKLDNWEKNHFKCSTCLEKVERVEVGE
jgi:hypothetical protein